MFYSLGPYTGSGAWDDPWSPPAGVVAHVDLRSIPAHATPGVGLFVSASRLPRDYRVIAEGDIDAVPREADRAVWCSALGIGGVSGDTVSDWITDTMTARASPDGDDGPGPLAPSGGRRLEIHLNRPVRSRFALDRCPALLEQYRRAYRRHRLIAQSGGMKDDHHHLRILAHKARSLGVDADLLRPADLPREALRRPETTIGDTFTDTDTTAITSHTATGSGGGFGWTALHNSGIYTIVSNACEQTGSNFGSARADSDLSSDDHSATVTFAQDDISGVTRSLGPLARKDSSATLSYYLVVARTLTGNPQFQTSKWVSGSLTEIGSRTNLAVSVGDALQIECNGSTIRRLLNASEQNSATDTAISGNVRCGFGSIHSVAGLAIDDFVATDLAAGGVTVPVLYLHRIQQGMS